MPKTNKPTDPMQGSLRWTWRRGQEHVAGFLVGVVILGAVGVVVANLLTAPSNASVGERIAYGVLGFLVSLLLVLAIALSWAYIRAPYEQRNVLRSDLTGLQSSIDLEGERRKRLSGSDDLANEECYLWELLALVPGQSIKPLVTDRTFTKCIFRGPAMAGLLDSPLDHCTLGEGEMETILLETEVGPRQGVVGFLHCNFVRCRFIQVGFLGTKSWCDKVRADAVSV